MRFSFGFTHVSLVLISTLFTTVGTAGTMARVIEARDVRHLVVEVERLQQTVTLAGVAPLVSDGSDLRYLQRAVVGHYVMLERDVTSGEVYLYLSPSGDLLNAALLREGWASAAAGEFAQRELFVRLERDAQTNWRGAWRTIQAGNADEPIFLGELSPDKSSARSNASSSPRSTRRSASASRSKATRKKR